jgi:hypothetical protein
VSEHDGMTGPSDIVLLGDEEATVGVLSKAVLGLWEVVNSLTRLRPTRRLRYRVAGPEDFTIPICCRDGQELLDVLRTHHSRWKVNQEVRP